MSQFRYLGSSIAEDGYRTKRFGVELRWERKYLWRKRNCLLVKESGTKEENNEILHLECSTVCSRGVDIDSDRQKKKSLKCGYGEEWKRSAGLIKLLTRKFSGE